MTPIRRIFIANRGEIAVRIIRTARALGIETVLGVSTVDRDSLGAQLATRTVILGPAPARESYLNIPTVITAAKGTGCDAIHPGYGFLSENRELALACEKNGLIFIGPTPDNLSAVGDKLTARGHAEAAGVPLVPGGSCDTAAEAIALSEKVGFQMLIKAVAGGGGKGMRRVDRAEDLAAQLSMAMTESEAAFGDPRVYLERFVTVGRHVEVQIISDGENVHHAGERDCSVQRRYQKLVEAAPAPDLSEKMRAGLYAAAIEYARSIGYKSMGTEEFLVDVERSEFCFLEMNARVQVEHPVNEAITGLDLIALQIAIAEGKMVPFAQGDIKLEGHAIEIRINAEDPANGFRPNPGRITQACFPDLAERKTQLAGTMSGGQQQMVAIGHALMARPKFMLIDEMSLDLAPLIVRRLMDVVTNLKARGCRACRGRRAFEDGRWRNMPPQQRKKVMLRWADLIDAEALELAVLGIRDNGTEIGMALRAEPVSAAGSLRYYAECIDKLYGEIALTPSGFLGLDHKAPVGVIAAIVPWNFPLMIGTWKLGPALAVGNSVVLKPSEMASLTLLRIAELALGAGVPPGVFNVVTGEGAEVGAVLAESMDVDVIVFTGSGATGRRLLHASAASNMKRCYLELGGKSANIVFADTRDLAEAAKVSAAGIFRNSGQVCVAGSRLLVERSVHDEFVDLLAKAAGAMKVGDPLDLSTQAGAVNNAAQLARNLEFVEKARAEGGDVVLGGRQILKETGGYFMEPKIVTRVEESHHLARNEVFGPVLAVTSFDTEEDAIRLANSTDFGLAGGVWTTDISRAHRMVRAMRTGVVHVNTYGGPDVTVPMGGTKQSGNGHDKSLHAFDKFVDLKTAWIKL